MIHMENVMSISEGYHDFIRECSVHWGDIMSTFGDIQHIKGIP